MDPLLEGNKLKPGELNTLTCMKEYEAATDFTSMTEKEKDGHIYVMQLRSGEDPELWNTLKNASYRGGRAAN